MRTKEAARRISDRLDAVLRERDRQLGVRVVVTNPTFTSYEDSQEWIAAKIREYGSKNGFLSSDEYRAAYPQIRALAEGARETYRAGKRKRLESSGASGQRVQMRWPGPFMSEQYATGTVRTRAGEPWVVLDEPIEGRSRVRWSESWRPLTNPAHRYRYLGTDDEQSTCSCCGKQNLKRVVWLVELDEDGNAFGEPMHYGTTCAAHLLRGTCGKKPTVGEAKRIIDAAAEAEKTRARIEFEENYRLARITLAHLRPPKAERTTNKWGVPLAVVGDATATYGSRWHTPQQLAEDWRGWDGQQARARAEENWFHNRVLEWMREHDQATAPFGTPRTGNPTDAELDQWEREQEAWEKIRDARKAEFTEDMRRAFKRDGLVQQPAWSMDSDWIVVLTQSARPGAVYQVTDFRGDEPMGHREFEHLDDAIADLWHHAPAEIKALPPMPNPGSRNTARTLARRISQL